MVLRIEETCYPTKTIAEMLELADFTVVEVRPPEREDRTFGAHRPSWIKDSTKRQRYKFHLRFLFE